MADIQLGYTAAQLNTLLNKLNNLYPVGSIYMSVNNTDPSTLYGGTWERIQDTFLMCAGSSYAPASTGGNASHNHAMAHTHSLGSDGYACFTVFSSGRLAYIEDGGKPTYSTTFGCNVSGAAGMSVDSTYGIRLAGNTNGVSTANTSDGNSLPPYLAVYVWKRTA